MKKVILASSSPYRKALLKRVLNDFECLSPKLDEDIIKSELNSPLEIANKLAELKALEIYKAHPDKIVIGSDQVCELEGQIFSKPGTIDIAFRQLTKMQGKTHRLITSVCVIWHNEKYKFHNITKLQMLSLSEKQINNYLRNDNPIDCAGSYKLELKGISLFEGIETTDQTAIMGLPLIELSKTLRKLGIEIPA
jgi:septum formation protein